jgi:hypothetical protein
LLTELLALLATQMLAPSKATATGTLPTPNVPRVAPVLASSLVTELRPLLATQMLVPSKATPLGETSVANVPPVAPVLASSMVTELLPLLATQMLVLLAACHGGNLALISQDDEVALCHGADSLSQFQWLRHL